MSRCSGAGMLKAAWRTKSKEQRNANGKTDPNRKDGKSYQLIQLQSGKTDAKQRQNIPVPQIPLHPACTAWRRPNMVVSGSTSSSAASSRNTRNLKVALTADDWAEDKTPLSDRTVMRIATQATRVNVSNYPTYSDPDLQLQFPSPSCLTWATNCRSQAASTKKTARDCHVRRTVD